ncbi:thioesterase II family protein [Xanthobacter autotrophicus]|uniref:thioesterase II family protein n=1 Tax=Xanthobacter autotrophicus TaxID=280 RepID=UPI0024A672FD|nr:alpha/beta fold hydrolase [Xanthobacter autotrophicus]MDI4656775.1 alpha/beta fold hydrolase [Xanthobacter autotrophicus]
MSCEPSPWFLGGATRGARRLRLFCLPFAGGNASAYAPWQAAIDPAIEVVPVQLPGHGGRIREAPFQTMDEMAEGLADAMVRRLDLPYAVFGHSMGALLAFETLRRLRARGASMPAVLFVSARRAPHLPPSRPPLHVLSDAELVGELRALNGTPDVVLGDRELLDLLLPVIRADLKAVETYRFREAQAFDFPIHAFGGTGDSIAEEDLRAWSRQSTAGFSLTLYGGDHFYLNDHRIPLLRSLESSCGLTQGELLP